MKSTDKTRENGYNFKKKKKKEAELLVNSNRSLVCGNILMANSSDL